jgi:hypothetical protein
LRKLFLSYLEFDIASEVSHNLDALTFFMQAIPPPKRMDNPFGKNAIHFNQNVRKLWSLRKRTC